MAGSVPVRPALALIVLSSAVYGQTGERLKSEADDRLKSLDARILTEIARFSGTVSLYAKNLDTGESYGLRENERVRTASTIKLPIMAAIFAAVHEGRAKWTDVLPVTESGKVSGSGVVRELSTGLRLPIRDLVNLMIVISDNTATNLLLDRFPGDYVNIMMDKLGLPQTRSLRMILGDGPIPKGIPHGLSEAGKVAENEKFGIGVSTPREMVTLLEKIAKGEVVSAAESKDMLAILKRQQYKDGIGRHLEENSVASKSGSLDHLRSDVGIVDSPGGRIALAITCDDIPVIDYSPDNLGDIEIWRLTRILLDGLGAGKK